MDVFVFIFGGLMDEKSETEDASVHLLLMVAESLKRNIEFAVRQLNSKKVKSEMKLKWSRIVVRHVEALIKVVEALNKLRGKTGAKAELDLASYLAGLESQIPKRFVSREFARIVKRMQRRASRHRTKN